MDINNDGYKDLIVGEEDGTVNLFLRKDNSSLEAGIKLQAGGSNIKVTNNSSPLVTDWDNDGDLDLLVGQKGPSEYSSDIKIFINEGNSSNYNFVSSGSVSVNGNTTLLQFYRAQLEYADLDGDGLKDLIVANANAGGNKGNVGFLKNRGSKSSPSFSEWINLQADGIDISMASQQTNASKKDARVRVIDWNGDGILDLLVACDNIFLYKGSGETVKLIQDPIYNSPNFKVVNNSGFLSFHIAGEEFDNAKAELIMTSGRKLKKIKGITKNGITSGVFKNISQGFYIIRIIGTERTIMKKIIVE